MKTFKLHFLLFLLLCVSCKNKLDRFEDAIIRSDIVYYSVDGVKIVLDTDSVKKATKDYMRTFKSKEITNNYDISFDDDRNNFSKIIYQEMEKWKWKKTIYPTELENFQYAKYYYDGYLSISVSVFMGIFADKNKKVSCIELYEKTDNWDFKETLLFKDDEVLSIRKCYSYPHSKGFFINSWISWTHEYEDLYFKGNRIYSRIVKSEKQKEPDFKKDMSNKEARRYEKHIGKAYYMRKLAQAIIDDKMMDCRKTKSFPLDFKIAKDFTDFFNENANFDILKSIDTAFVFVESLRVKINSKGETDTVILMFSNYDEYSDNDNFKIVFSEVSRILHKIKWQPATENCMPINSEKEISVDFNNIYKRAGNSKHKKGKFSASGLGLPEY